jgi:hypothetical protein
MDFTVIGDIVNSASRLEALTKHYGLSIVISEDLRNVLLGDYRLRFVDIALVKGKVYPVRVFEVFDSDREEIVELKQRNQPLMDEAFELYRTGAFVEAAGVYEGLIAGSGGHAFRRGASADPLLDFYKRRCMVLEAQRRAGTLEDWRGIYEFTEK